MARYIFTDFTNQLQMVDIPVSQQDIGDIQNILRSEKVFVTAGTEIDCYELKNYIYTNLMENITVKALLDRNLISRIISLVKGIKLEKEQADYHIYQVTAAIMAFLILGHIINEPNISLYEYGNSEDNEKVNEELFLFRIADHIHPQHFIDIALGRSTYIDESIIVQTKNEYLQSHTITEQYCFTNKLNIRKLNYLFVLKIALLERSQLGKREKFERFTNWIVEETFFNAIAIGFAIVYMGHNRKRPLLEKAKSQSIEILKRNICAATWDMTYICYWGKCVKKNIDKEFWILCTKDIALNVIANTLFCYDNEKAANLKLRKLFIENWNEKDGKELFDKYKRIEMSAQKKDPLHQNQVKTRFEKVDEIIIDLEQKLGI